MLGRVWLSASLMLLAFAATVLADELVLIVNPTNPIGSMAAQSVKNIFLGKRITWPNGKKIIIVIQDDTEVHASFTEQFINKSPRQLDQIWKQALFTGTGMPPQKVKNDSEVKGFVARTPDAIGYISRESLDDSVKILKAKP
jgi:ABC-type phosphate transport system substrate-binding protein